jgi:hypothetical protein
VVDRRVVLFNAGLVAIGVAVVLPWADVAGRPRSGPSFANLLLSLPDVAMLGSHLTVVAAVWYSIPLLALATWTTQFRSWPPALDRLTAALAVALLVATFLMVAWLAIRDVGFPSPGAVVAAVGAVLVLGAAWPRRRVEVPVEVGTSE